LSARYGIRASLVSTAAALTSQRVSQSLGTRKLKC
jgi:hypothetical protein